MLEKDAPSLQNKAVAKQWVTMAKKPIRRDQRPAWARRLEAARSLRYETQTDFATKLGISQQRYSNYENGSREPDIELWGRIVDELRVSADNIMFGPRDEQ